MKKMLSWPVVFISLFLLILDTEKANSQELEIGFVDFYSILERMPEMQAVQQRIQNFAGQKIQELQDKERELQMSYEEFQQTADVLSESAREREEERLQGLGMEFQQLQMQARQEVDQYQMELMQPLLEEIQNAIAEVALEHDVDYILKTTTDTGDQVVLWVAPEIQQEYDLTDEVMQRVE